MKEKKVLIPIILVVIGIVTIIAITGGSSNDYDDSNANNIVNASDNDSNISNNSEPIDYEILRSGATLLYPSSNDEWEYNVYEDSSGRYEKFIEITSCKIDLSTELIEIPEFIEDYPVIALGNAAMINFKGEELIIPDTVIYIDEFFCAWCENLEKLTLSSSVVTIKDSAFRNNHLLVLELPNTVQKIGECAFVKAERQVGDNIKEIILPESLMYIGYSGVEAEEITVLNPNMEFGDASDGGLYAKVFYGYAGSTTAEFCAQQHNEFKVIS